MHFLRFAGALLLASSAVGCGPYLTSRAVPTSHAYASPVRCGQGPYEFHATAIGHKWGESVALYQAGEGRERAHVGVPEGGWVLQVVDAPQLPAAHPVLQVGQQLVAVAQEEHPVPQAALGVG